VALIIVLFILVPIAELYLIIRVGEAIGVLPTIALLLADALLGAMLLRLQGRGAWRRFNEALAERRFPGREVADGLMIAVGATLLLTPGFITDVFGFCLLIPPTRAIVRRLMRAYLGRRFIMVGLADRAGRKSSTWTSTRPYDFDATAEEVRPDDHRQLSG
jgi:UPF0716 protein FxsA